jgi:hypothetical protein
MIVLFSKPMLDLNVNFLFSCMTFVLAVPLFLSLLTDLPLVFATTKLRQIFNDKILIEKALFFVLAQSSILLIFSKKTISINIFELLTKNSKSEKNVVIKNTLSITLIIISTYMCNRTGSIFDGNYGGDGFYGESSSFGGWPIIFCFSCAFLIVINNMNKFISTFLIIILLYWLFHGNRSEVLVLAILPFVTLMYGSNGRISIKNGLKFLFFFILVLGLFQFIGLYREVSNIDNMVSNSNELSEGRSLSISTIGPSAYSITSAIGLIDTGRMVQDNGEKYLNLAMKIIPNALNPFDTKEDFSETLIYSADAIGGAHNIGEAYASYGPFGVYFFSFSLGIIFMIISNKKRINPDNKVFLIALLIYLPRIVLYGNIYFVKFLSFYFLVAFAVFFIRRINK